MDATAIAICQDNNAHHRVDFFKAHNLMRVVMGEPVGTMVTG
jgi:uridylate kinase